MNAVDHKCPACCATLPYNPESGTWKCPYCTTEYTLEQLESFEKTNETSKKTKSMDVDEYSCPNCGAKIITDENTTATFCVYCGSTSIIKNRLLGELEPDAIIPFKTTKEQAIEAFKKSKKGKLFAPRDFAKKEQIDKITGVYIPFWLYDCKADGEAKFSGKNTTSWTVGDYRYTKVDTYSSVRAGDATFDNVPVDGSQKFDDDMMDSIEPFDWEGLEDFSISYLSGFLSDKYDVDVAQASDRAKTRVENTLVDEFTKDIKVCSFSALTSKNISTTFSDTRYVLLPVWMLNIKYKGKMHLFAMNGQTGKIIGNIPVSPLLATVWATCVFLALTAIAYIFMTMIS